MTMAEGKKGGGCLKLKMQDADKTLEMNGAIIIEIVKTLRVISHEMATLKSLLFLKKVSQLWNFKWGCFGFFGRLSKCMGIYVTRKSRKIWAKIAFLEKKKKSKKEKP